MVTCKKHKDNERVVRLFCNKCGKSTGVYCAYCLIEENPKFECGHFVMQGYLNGFPLSTRSEAPF